MPNSAICSIPDCGKPAKARGLCNAHYIRLTRHGDAMGGGDSRAPRRFPHAHKTCLVPGCGKRATERGWCSPHYNRWARHGDPLGGGPSKPGKGSKNRYLRDVALHYEGDDCLIWPFPFGKSRPTLWTGGHNTSACRVICSETYGPPPNERDQAAHSCGKGHLGCVNKRHLSWKTPQANSDDKAQHGTKVEGGKVHKARVTAEQVLEIRAIGHTVVARELAVLYGVDRSTISDILNRRSWKHLATS